MNKLRKLIGGEALIANYQLDNIMKYIKGYVFELLDKHSYTTTKGDRVVSVGKIKEELDERH